MTKTVMNVFRVGSCICFVLHLKLKAVVLRIQIVLTFSTLKKLFCSATRGQAGHGAVAMVSSLQLSSRAVLSSECTRSSDALIVQERQGLLKTMDDEKAKQLMVHLKKQWIFSISALGPDFAVLCSTEPSDKFYAEHYDFRPQPASSLKSLVFN